MRDLIVLSIVFLSVPIALFRPYYGVLVWVWIAYFNPHRFTWTYAYNFPVAMTIAIPTLIGIFFARQLNRRFLVREMVLLSLLWIWFGIVLLNAMHTPAFAGHVADAIFEMNRVSKALLMTYVMALLVTSEKKLKYLVLVTAFSFGILAIKGAVFGLRTAGAERVWGPPDSFIADNNGFALALNMTLPFLFYLARAESNRWLRLALNIAFFGGIISVVLTYSRGGLLGLAAVLGLISLKSRYKVAGVAMLLITGVAIVTFAPGAWMDRMSTLQSNAQGEHDGSAEERIVTWQTGLRFVQDYPLMGGSFQTLPDAAIFQRYQPRPLPNGFRSSGPHSIWIQTVSEQGIVGLILFTLMIGSSLLTFRSVRRRARQAAALQWMVPYTQMFEVGLLGFLVSGTFLGLAYFDLFYQFIASAALIKILYRREALALSASESPVEHAFPRLAEQPST